MTRLLCLTELLRPTSHPLPTRCGWTAGTPAAAGTDLAYRDLGVTLARPAVGQWLWVEQMPGLRVRGGAYTERGGLRGGFARMGACRQPASASPASRPAPSDSPLACRARSRSPLT